MSDPLLELITDCEPATGDKNRANSLGDNVIKVRREFHGMPEVCHKLASHIIHLRREVDMGHHHFEFYKCLNQYRPVILEHYNVRWLLSICDTIVDVGDVTSSAIAMNIVQCVNGTNLHNTLLVNAVDGGLDTHKLQRDAKVPTWGGMVTADVPTGDMIFNMMKRLDRVIGIHPLLNEIWQKIKLTGRYDENVAMNHVCKHSTHKDMRLYFQ